MEGLDILTQIKNYNLIIISELTNIEKLYKINENCSNNNIGFIYTLALGITEVCFFDFGEHNITDKDREEKKTYLIKNISKNGEFFIDKTISNENFKIAKGNYVNFREIKGINELNNGKPRQIIKSTPIYFFISDKLKYEDYFQEIYVKK